MQFRNPELFILGATGFVGRQVVREALERGYRVKALVRNTVSALDLAQQGVSLVPGNAQSVSSWVGEAAGASILIDLIQPELPKRITVAAIRKVAQQRLAVAIQLTAALQTIPLDKRPLLMSVSGMDDFVPDEEGRVDDDSPLRTRFVGFSHIGLPVRRCIEASGVRSVFAYLGTVYGPGKAFANSVFPRLAAGNFRMAGSGNNRTPMVHVDDVARSLVHLAGLGAAELEGRSFVIADGANATVRQFFEHAAELMGTSSPRSTPLWLANLFAGKVLVETLSRDVAADPAALRKTGFRFQYASYRQGLPPTLAKLGYEKKPATPKLLDSSSAFGILAVLAVGILITANLIVNLGGLQILDMHFWYSQSTAYKLLDVLGATGRRVYLTFLWSVDLAAPLLFGTFLSAAIRRTPLRRLSALPLVAAAFDYAENIAITVLLVGYPIRLPAIVMFASIFTAVKWTLYVSGITAAAAGFLQKVGRKEWLRQ